MKNIYVVIPNWNGADLIAECLLSLKKQAQEHEVIVVDNGSVDESIGIIKARFPDVELIRLPKNIGFAGGVNVGIRRAMELGAEMVALFNNDATADKKWLEECVVAMKSQPKYGIVTCKLMRTDKRHLDSAGDFYSIWGMPFPRGRNHIDNGQFDRPEKVFGATGGASLYRISMLEDIGLFDERFFAYYEDVDVSFRAHLAGWDVFYEPRAVAYHNVSATSSKLGNFTRYHATKNFFMLYIKNMPGILFWKYLPYFVLQGLLLGGSSTLKGKIITYVKGFCGFAVNIPAVLMERHRIQKYRQTSISEIDALLYKRRPPGTPKL